MNRMIYISGVVAIALLVAFSWRLHDSSVRQGEQLAMEHCAGCHDLTEKRTNNSGPYLWGVVNRRAGEITGFGYSDAFREYAAARKFSWTEASLDGFIADPERLIPGTIMVDSNGGSRHAEVFTNVNDPEQRRQLIRYLRTLE